MSTLTAEQRALGAANAREALGFSRRDFLKAAAAAPALGAFYFSYGKLEGHDPVRAVLIGTGDEGCQAMVRDHNRDYVNYIGFCDIRPTQLERCKAEFAKHAQYTPRDVETLRIYDDYKQAIADPDVEMVVIALPLFLHAPVAIEALKAGKHVFTEKLMAKTVAQCKDMIQVARANNRLLAVGHQRHYSTTYDNANHLIRQGYLGEIRHIRALWHRNNGQPIYARRGATLEYNDNGHARWSNPDAPLEYDANGNPIVVLGTKERNGLISDGKPLYWDSWSRGIPDKDRGVDFAKHGYGSLHELIAWRLYDKYGAGLMAELGSHQLDACSIFLGKVHPLSVSGYGGKYHFRDNREVDDHVFAQFEFPALSADGQPRDDERVIVTYSSICTNAYEKYGETVMGTLGTLVLEEEKDLYLFREGDRNRKNTGPARDTAITMTSTPAGKPVMEASASWSGSGASTSIAGVIADGKPFRGYREELEHFAWCIRQGDPKNYINPSDETLKPRCRGEVALADAVIALTSNIAMREGRRIEFKPEWFNPDSPETPDGSKPDYFGPYAKV